MSSNRAKATFEVTSWDETPYAEPADGLTLSRITVAKNFSGEIEGESIAELLTCQAAEAAAGYVAYEVVVARVGGRAGSFVIQHAARRDGSDDRLFGVVVPGSGTGELTGLRGEGEFRREESGATFTLDYTLE
jgi:hypothetical protein